MPSDHLVCIRHMGSAMVVASAAILSAACGQPPATSPLAPTCAPTVSLAASTFGPAGGSATAEVMADAACPWSATSQVEWVSIAANTAGRGNGSVPFAVAQFEGTAPRSGNLVIAGSELTLTQTG